MEAVSPLETFVIEPASDDGSASGVFRLKTSSGAYFCTRPKPSASRKQADTVLPPLPDIRGDGSKESDSGDSTTLVRIRMQARFKPKLQAQKEERAAREKVSRRELEAAAGRRLDDEEVKRLRRARREGDYHEQLLRLKIKGKHDKFG